MTFKKSMISISAAAVIAASLTGCGSSSSSTQQNQTGIQSSVKAVDGYIYNALVKAHYLADDNITMKTVTLSADSTTKDAVTNKVTLGGSSYKLATADDANTSIKNRIRYFSIASKVSTTSGTTFTPASYIEADGVDGFDVNDTALGATLIYAPATSAIASPLTSLIYQANPALFNPTTATGELNATTIAQIESNASKIATNLGLTGVDLLTADPIDMATKNPTFKLVTALLKGANAADAAAVLAATPATTLAETLAIVVTATSGNANAKTLATSLQAMAENGAFKTSDIASVNIEKSVATGSYATLTAPTIKGKFPVSGLTVDGVMSTDLSAAGAKWDSTGTVDINMTLASSDMNVSNTSFSVLVAVKGTKDNMGYDDSNNSSAVVAEIPFDLNITSGAVMTKGIVLSKNIPYQVRAKDGSQVVTMTDINASTLGLVAGDVAVTSDILKINVANIITALKTAGDANTTADLEVFDGIADIQVLLKDASGLVVGATDAETMLPLARATFTDIGTGTITATEAYKLVSNMTVDMRNATTGKNNPSTFTNLDGNVSGTTIETTYADAAKLSRIAPVTISQDSGENNGTVSFASLPSWVTMTSTSGVSANGTSVDFNITTDSNLTLADTNTTVAITVKDEFSKVNTDDANVSFFFNALPTVSATTTSLITNFTKVSGTSYTADINITEVNGTNLVFALSNMMGEANTTVKGDFNATAADTMSQKHMNVDLNSTTGVGTVTLYDLNATTQGASDMNMTITEGSITIDLNVSE